MNNILSIQTHNIRNIFLTAGKQNSWLYATYIDRKTDCPICMCKIEIIEIISKILEISFLKALKFIMISFTTEPLDWFAQFGKERLSITSININVNSFYAIPKRFYVYIKTIQSSMPP